MNHELLEAKQLKIFDDDCEGTISTLQLIENTTSELSSNDCSDESKTANTEKQSTNAAERESHHHTYVEQFLACFFVGTEFYVWLYSPIFLFAPLLYRHQFPNIFEYSTFYYLSCLSMAACVVFFQVFAVVATKIRKKQSIAPSWTEFFSDRRHRAFQVEIAPDEAFTNCIAVLNKTCSRNQATSFDIFAREITVNCLSRKLRVRVNASGEGSLVELEFVAGRPTFWHYYHILDGGMREDYLSLFEREFTAMNSALVPSTLCTVKVGRRTWLNKAQVSTLCVCAMILISSLFGRTAWNHVQKIDLQKRFDHCMTSIDWVNRSKLAVDEFTKVVEIATNLQERDVRINALTFRGYTQLRRSHLVEARSDFEKALELIASDKSIRSSDELGLVRLKCHLVETLLRQGHFAEAETLLQQVIERGGNAPETVDPDSIHYLRGLKEFKSGDKEAAITHLLHSKRQEASQLLSVLLANEKDDLRKLHLSRALSNLNAPARDLLNCPFRSPVSSIPTYLIALLGALSLARFGSHYWITKANLKKLCFAEATEATGGVGKGSSSGEGGTVSP